MVEKFHINNYILYLNQVTITSNFVYNGQFCSQC